MPRLLLIVQGSKEPIYLHQSTTGFTCDADWWVFTDARRKVTAVYRADAIIGLILR